MRVLHRIGQDKISRDRRTRLIIVMTRVIQCTFRENVAGKQLVNFLSDDGKQAGGSLCNHVAHGYTNGRTNELEQMIKQQSTI